MNNPRRKNLRLKNYDYRQNGYYFVTICTQDRVHYFENHPELKQIVHDQWHELPKRFANIQLDEFVIMPNHIHGIIAIVGAPLVGAPIGANRAGARPAPTLGGIIGAYKSICVHEWLKLIKKNGLNVIGRFWQRNYYEHVIRGEMDLFKIRNYIRQNPLNWNNDEYNPSGINE